MWPHDRGMRKEYLRVGRHSVERWQGGKNGLTLLGRHGLNADAPLQNLGEALQTLYGVGFGSPVTLLCESNWLPLMLIDTGPALLGSTALDALARHRFAFYYGDGREPVSEWEMRIEHRPGDRHALVYGLSPNVKRACLEAAKRAGVKLEALLPMLAWGLERARSTRSLPSNGGWLLWTEQDRTLVTHVSKGRVDGLNAGASRATAGSAVLAHVDAESARLGLAEEQAVAASVWDGLRTAAHSDERLIWIDLRGSTSSSSNILASATPSEAAAWR